jgi:hypothetical protein
MIYIKLTSIQGTEKIVEVNTIKDAHQYVQELPKRLKNKARVRVDCDIAGLNGWITGTHPAE